MRNLNIYAILISVVVLASCGTSHDVVDGGLFQKRKYNKGYHFNKKSKVDFKSSNEQEVAFELPSNIAEESTPTSPKVDAVKETMVSVNNSSNTKLDIKAIQDTPIKASSSSKVDNTGASGISLVRSTRTNKKLSLSSLISTHFKSQNGSNISDIDNTLDNTLLLVIIALFIPFLAVGLYEGITTRFWISLLLTLLFVLPGVIYAILVVTGTI